MKSQPQFAASLMVCVPTHYKAEVAEVQCSMQAESYAVTPDTGDSTVCRRWPVCKASLHMSEPHKDMCSKLLGSTKESAGRVANQQSSSNIFLCLALSQVLQVTSESGAHYSHSNFTAASQAGLTHKEVAEQPTVCVAQCKIIYLYLHKKT